ncbi:hypothetical protein NC651_001026 [Populus alba x Populus x berolinensis]|nr:hypothetical protein NC651_001026 [Populus alba x Populus x berolinensis]
MHCQFFKYVVKKSLYGEIYAISRALAQFIPVNRVNMCSCVTGSALLAFYLNLIYNKEGRVQHVSRKLSSSLLKTLLDFFTEKQIRFGSGIFPHGRRINNWSGAEVHLPKKTKQILKVKRRLTKRDALEEEKNPRSLVQGGQKFEYSTKSFERYIDMFMLRGFHVVHNSNGGKWKLVRVCCDFAFHSREIRFFHKKPVQIFNYFSNC